MSRDTDFFGADGGSLAYPTGQEITISASTTLTAAAHGGKTLEICMDQDGQTITLYSAAGISPKQRRVGIKVAANSKEFAIKNAGTVNTDQVLEVILGPGACGALFARALTTLGNWAWIGRGQLRKLWQPGSPSALYDVGAGVDLFNSFTPHHARSTFVNGGNGFAITYSHTNNVYAAIASFDANKSITWGSQQTVRDTAATFKDPALGAASGGGLAFAWFDSTNTKIEAVGATVDLGARTISVGSVVDVNSVSTTDPNSDRGIGILPDASTANQLFLRTRGSNGLVNAMTLSGNTLTVDGDNIGVGWTNLDRIAPSVANKVLVPRVNTYVTISQLQYSGGSMSVDWEYVLNSGTSMTGLDGIVKMSPTRYFASLRGQITVFETDAGSTGITRLVQAGSGIQNTGSATYDTTAQVINNALPLGENHIAFIPSITVTNGMPSYAIIDVRELFLAASAGAGQSQRAAVAYPVAFTNGAEAFVTVLAIHPTTKDILMGVENYRNIGSNNKQVQCVILETPRNL